MARIVQMVDTETGDIVNMYSADARECLRSKNPRYRPYTDKGKAVLETQPEKILPKEEDHLVPADITQPGRGQGVRGGEVPVVPAAQVPTDIPVEPQVLPEQPAPATGPAVPSDSLLAAIEGQASGDPSDFE